MTLLNFALRHHKDIDHWVIYHLKDVCEVCRRRIIFHELISFLVVVLETLTSILTGELHDRDKCVGSCSCGKMSG